jgi:Tfp pilus assembly protein PilN
MAINLLPWRKQQYWAQWKRCGFFILMQTLSFCLVISVLQWVISSKISSAKQQEKNWQAKMPALAEALKKDKNAFKLPQSSGQTTQQQSVLFLQALPQQLPASLHLVTLQQEESQFQLSGKARRESAVSEFLQKLTNLPGVQQVHLVRLEKNTGSSIANFDINVQLLGAEE